MSERNQDTALFREEKFGGIFYDPHTGRYDYVSKEEVAEKLSKLRAEREVLVIKNKDIVDCYLNAPEEIGIDITQRCNLSCKHCYKDSGASSKSELSTKELFSIIDEASQAGVFCLYISGGEATCRPDLFEVVDYAREKGLRSIVTTNGAYGKDICDKIASAGFVKVQISLDGPKEVHDNIRGKGSFDKSVSSIKYLKSRGVSIRISCHLCNINVGVVKEMVKLADSLGVAIKFSTIRPIGRQQQNAEMKMLSGENFSRAIKEVLSLKKIYPTIQITCDFDKLMANESFFPMPAGGNNRCLAAEKTITIDSSGNVYPCSFFTPFPEFNAGNVKKDGFMKIWRSSDIFKRFRARNSSKECTECEHFEKNCLGGCPAISYAVFGDAEMLDPTCPKRWMKD